MPRFHHNYQHNLESWDAPRILRLPRAGRIGDGIGVSYSHDFAAP